MNLLKNSILLFLMCLCTFHKTNNSSAENSPAAASLHRNLAHSSIISKDISAESLDELVIAGIKYIVEHGEKFEAKSGNGQQADEVQYTLLNPQNRLHLLRQPISIKYFCAELLAYFKGSLNVEDGLAQASPFWRKLANEEGKIASNYGYYIFHQKIPGSNTTQYDWLIEQLVKNPNAKNVFININQPCHKDKDAKDFPCTLGMHFFINDNHVSCIVSSRSTDIYTGLPYDMGFFALVLELVYVDLKARLPEGNRLKLGYVTMKTHFTQIYDKTREKVLELLKKKLSDISTKSESSKQSPASSSTKNIATIDLNELSGQAHAASSATSSIEAETKDYHSFIETTDTTFSTKAFDESLGKPSEGIRRQLSESSYSSFDSHRNSPSAESQESSASGTPCKLSRRLSIPEPITSNSATPTRSPSRREYVLEMPTIKNAQELLQDIKNQTATTELMKWIYKHAQQTIPQ